MRIVEGWGRRSKDQILRYLGPFVLDRKMWCEDLQETSEIVTDLLGPSPEDFFSKKFTVALVVTGGIMQKHNLSRRPIFSSLVAGSQIYRPDWLVAVGERQAVIKTGLTLGLLKAMVSCYVGAQK